MTKNKVGYGRPPEHSRFKKGVSGNPKGRPRKQSPAICEAIESVMNVRVAYTVGGRKRRDTRRNLSARQIVLRAVKGDVGAAAALLELRKHAERGGAGETLRIFVEGGLPDLPDNQVEQKSPDALIEAKPAGSAGRREFQNDGKADETASDASGPPDPPKPDE